MQEQGLALLGLCRSAWWTAVMTRSKMARCSGFRLDFISAKSSVAASAHTPS